MEDEKLGSNLIFIICQPRSGSTLLQLILNGHPEIHTVAEPWIMLHPLYVLKDEEIQAEYYPDITRRALRDFFKELPEGEKTYIEGLRRMHSFLYGSALRSNDMRYFLDKTPAYYLIIPELYRVFPKAKYIFLLRNPLAVFSSILVDWTKGFWQNLYRYRVPLLKAPPLLADGIEHLGDNAIVVHYENLTSCPEETVTALCESLQLPFVPTMLDYGQRPFPKGRIGDHYRIHLNAKPVPDYINKWIDVLSTPQNRHLGKAYLDTLGSELLSRLDYSYNELNEALHSRKSREGRLILSWHSVMKPPEERAIWDNIYMRMVASIKQRGFLPTVHIAMQKALDKLQYRG